MNDVTRRELLEELRGIRGNIVESLVVQIDHAILAIETREERHDVFDLLDEVLEEVEEIADDLAKVTMQVEEST